MASAASLSPPEGLEETVEEDAVCGQFREDYGRAVGVSLARRVSADVCNTSRSVVLKGTLPSFYSRQIATVTARSCFPQDFSIVDRLEVQVN